MKICPTCKSEYSGGEVFCPVDATRLATPSQLPPKPPFGVRDSLVGTVLAGRYEVIRRIGEGGMGLVYEGRHNVIEKRVAIKVLRDEFTGRTDVVERFRQEAKSASRIGHQNIVDIGDFGETPSGASYFVMEFLEGEDLANVLARERCLPQERAANIVLQCCRALGAAHAKGIVHRDMKPENVFLTTRDGQSDFVKIVDFGIAKMSDVETAGAPGRKLTKTGMIFGTPEYMSPEQAAGKPLDHRVDIYALGVILYELVTGRVPFVGDSFMGILTQHMFEPPPALKDSNAGVRVSSALESVIWAALAKDPNERFQTMDELAHALTEATQGRAVETTKVGFVDPEKARVEERKPSLPAPARSLPPPPPRRSTRAGLLVGLGAAALALAGAGIYVGRGHSSTTPGSTRSPDGAATVEARPVGGPVAATAVADAAVADAAVAERVPDAAIAPTEPPAATPEAPPARVDVRVDTVPAGADVLVEGADARCSPTPCTVSLAPGQTVRVRAERGRASGDVEITPTEAMAVQIALATRATRARGSGDVRPARPRHEGDLKIPDIFR